MTIEAMGRHRPTRGLRWSPRALFVLFATLLIGCAGQAQTGDEPLAQPADPARLGVVEGQVLFWRQGQADWAPAQLNTAVVAGDALRTGAQGTAELQVGARDFVRLTADTQVNLVAHEPRLMQFRVEAGLASFDLRGVEAGHLIEIDTADATVMVGGRGYYRVDVHGNAMRLLVREGGRAAVTPVDAGRSHDVANEEELVVSGGGVQRRAAPPADAWDRWNDDRSNYYAAARSRQYLPEGVYGAADLDAYGNWRQMPDYGAVWVPAVAPGWSPYSAGDWQWDPYYGWTWVDDAPWGWSTSHYGRWTYIDSYWAWAPGPRVVRPVYAPALVAFFRRSGGVSWVALGWGEPLVPWWGRAGFRGTPWWGGWGGPRIVNNVVVRDRFSDASSIVFRNAGVAQAVIGVRQEDFGRQRVHGSHLPPPNRNELVVIRGDHPVRPARPSVMPRLPAAPVPARAVPPAAPATMATPAPRIGAPSPVIIAPRLEPRPEFRREGPPAVMVPRPEPRLEPRPAEPHLMPRPEPRPEPRSEPRPQFRREMSQPGGMGATLPRAVLPEASPPREHPRRDAAEPRGGRQGEGPDFGRGGWRRERE